MTGQETTGAAAGAKLGAASSGITGATPSATSSSRLAQDFVHFAIESGVLKFGQFKTKAGRLSPYFFNAGLFDDGAKLGRLAQFYAQRLLLEEETSGLKFEIGRAHV